MRAVTLTHNDLDGLGCLVMLMIKFRPEEHFFSNYHDFEKVASRIIKYKYEHDVDTLLIADLSFSEHKDILRRLAHAFEGNIFLVDHHMYPEGFWSEFSFRHVIDTSRCATRILFEDLKLKDDIKDKEFAARTHEFVTLVDTWDRYQDTDALFERAMYTKEMLEGMKTDNASLVSIAKDLIGHHYGILGALDSFKTAYDAGYIKRRQELDNLELIWRFPRVTFIFDWDYMPKFLADEYNNGQHIVVAVKYGIFKVRISRHGGIPEDSINTLRFKLTGMKDFCHLHAFTYKTECHTPAQIATECKRILDAVNEMDFGGNV